MLKAEDFAGEWSLRRAIDDRLADQLGTFEGIAKFVAGGEGSLKYLETGSLRLGQGPLMTATREYDWDFGAEEVTVTFPDGRPFHSFKPTGKSSGTDHPCGDDYYKVAYDFSDWPKWTAQWTVSGPRKDYTSTTHYLRH